MTLDDAEKFLQRNPRARIAIECIPTDLISRMDAWYSTTDLDCPDDYRVNLVEVYKAICPAYVPTKPVSKRLTSVVRDWLRQER